MANGQWIYYPTAGIPRTKDGKANLTGPAPKAPNGRPDLSGMWRASSGKYLADLAADLAPEGAPFQPWAAALFQKRLDNLAKDRPSGLCMPHGVPDQMAVPTFPAPDDPP